MTSSCAVRRPSQYAMRALIGRASYMVSSAASHWAETAAAPSASPAATQAFSAARSLPKDSRCSQVPQRAAVEGLLWRERERSRRRLELVDRARLWLPGHAAAGAEPKAPDCDWLCQAAQVRSFAGASQPSAATAGVAADCLRQAAQAQPQYALV